LSEFELRTHALDARLLGRVLDDFPLCVAVTDLVGTVLFVNREAERMLGYSASEVVGGSIAKLRASGRHESAMLEVKRVLETGRWAGEIRARHKDGRDFPAQVVWSKVTALDDRSRTVALVAVFRNLLPDRQREARLRRETRIQSIGEIAGRIAHEFNNVLGGMVSAADFALSDGSPARLRRALEQCLAGAERVTRVAHLLRLLAFEGHPAATPIDLDQLLDHLLAGLAERAAAQQVEIVREFAPAPPVVAEVGLLEQAVNAILQNAVEAMPAGGRLAVSLARLHGDALITIEDTGPGIPPEHQERIFDLFFTTKPSALGADVGLHGLGAGLARLIIERLGGQITLTSRPERGTVFAILLPGAPGK
jgi:two-component system cell cycle sensor histidine kinase/response regulator CckA